MKLSFSWFFQYFWFLGHTAWLVPQLSRISSTHLPPLIVIFPKILKLLGGTCRGFQLKRFSASFGIWSTNHSARKRKMRFSAWYISFWVQSKMSAEGSLKGPNLLNFNLENKTSQIYRSIKALFNFKIIWDRQKSINNTKKKNNFGSRNLHLLSFEPPGGQLWVVRRCRPTKKRQYFPNGSTCRQDLYLIQMENQGQSIDW